MEIPDRFETLEQLANESDVRLDAIIEPVASGLRFIDDVYDDMQAAGRGAFRVIQGASGCGKTTLMRTLHFFKEGVETRVLPPAVSIPETLADLLESDSPLRVLVIEGREIRTQVEPEDLERTLQAINVFIRSPAGRRTLVVWPCTDERLTRQILQTGDLIGSDALLGPDKEAFLYSGPPQDQYVRLATRMIEQLHRETTLELLGISIEKAEEIAPKCDTLGTFLGLLRQEARRRRFALQERLKDREPFRLWVVLSDGRESGDLVQGLVQGAYSRIDLGKLFSATQANVIQELAPQRADLGLLVSQYDVRLLHLPLMVTVAIARSLASRYPEELADKLAFLSFKTRKKPAEEDLERLRSCDLGRAFGGVPMGQLRPGPKPKEGGGSEEAFQKLHQVVGGDDKSIAMNRVLGDALLELGLIAKYEVEAPLSEGWTVKTDLLCRVSGAIPVRLEVTWRNKAANRGLVAMYVLDKLLKYGKALGVLR